MPYPSYPACERSHVPFSSIVVLPLLYVVLKRRPERREKEDGVGVVLARKEKYKWRQENQKYSWELEAVSWPRKKEFVIGKVRWTIRRGKGERKRR